MKILIAEDDSNISLIAKITLEKIGHHLVTVVTNGKLALDKALQEDFDLILLDGMMPIMDGTMVLKKLKESPKAHIPIIFLSAKSQESEIKEILSLGAIGYIQKPFEPQSLCSEINRLLENVA